MRACIHIFLLFLILFAPVGSVWAQEQKDLLLVPIRDTPAVDKMAVVIGIDDYEMAGKLTACGKDARAFARFLQEKMNFPAQSIVVMTDNAVGRLKPDRININRTLRNFIQGIDENSEVVFFFSGHGLRDKNKDYLAPQDGDPDNIDETCISYNKLRDELESKTPRRCLLLTDACRNIQGKGIDDGFGVSAFASEPQFAELRSCRPGEKSQEMPDGSMGVFTNFLLKGLNGEAATLSTDKKTVTFDALKRYVTGNTRQFVLAQLGAPQNPDGRASFGDMVLADDLKPIDHAKPLPFVIPKPVPAPQPQRLPVLDYRNLQLSQTLTGHTHAVKSVTFSPDGRILASGSGDNTIKLWDVATGQERQTLKGHTWSVDSVTFSPDGRILASGSGDTTAKLWQLPATTP